MSARVSRNARQAVERHGRGIPLYDRYGRLKSTTTDVTCPKCYHWANVVVPAGQSPRYRCSKCGTVTDADLEDDEDE